MQKDTQYWYASWFDTPYYHILYQDRDDTEAGKFMDTLTSFLKLPLNAEILDLACGKGRHAQYLNKIGYDVTGIDLSPESIHFAKQFEKKGLCFEEHDMSIPYPKKFDVVLNLFTSFGYFEKEEDNLRTIQSIKSELKPNGFGVIDFLNSEYLKKHIVPSEIKIVDDIAFRIEREIKEGYIIKNISFNHKGKEFVFTERVKALTLLDFQEYFKISELRLQHCFGDYHLNPFDDEFSERLILIFS